MYTPQRWHSQHVMRSHGFRWSQYKLYVSYTCEWIEHIPNVDEAASVAEPCAIRYTSNIRICVAMKSARKSILRFWYLRSSHRLGQRAPRSDTKRTGARLDNHVHIFILRGGLPMWTRMCTHVIGSSLPGHCNNVAQQFYHPDWIISLRSPFCEIQVKCWAHARWFYWTRIGWDVNDSDMTSVFGGVLCVYVCLGYSHLSAEAMLQLNLIINYQLHLVL